MEFCSAQIRLYSSYALTWGLSPCTGNTYWGNADTYASTVTIQVFIIELGPIMFPDFETLFIWILAS